jgi:hypothetical protein
MMGADQERPGAKVPFALAGFFAALIPRNKNQAISAKAEFRPFVSRQKAEAPVVAANYFAATLWFG